jgi:fructose-1,6-bisphosphatase/inositol monophosphatase family enzyme
MSDIQKIVSIARKAGEIVMKYKESGKLETTYKTGPYDPVTIADKEAGEYITTEIKKLYPEDKILSEESADVPKDYEGRVWMIDPIDATMNYVSGGTSFSIMIGLTIDGKPQAGVVYLPARDWMFYASKGEGSWMTNGQKTKKLQIRDVDEINEATAIMATGYDKKVKWRFLERMPVSKIIVDNSVGTRLARIAMNDADLHVCTSTTIKKWDTCAGQVILEEAGGIMTDLEGSELDYKKETLEWDKSFVATSPKIHKRVLEWVRKRQ